MRLHLNKLNLVVKNFLISLSSVCLSLEIPREEMMLHQHFCDSLLKWLVCYVSFPRRQLVVRIEVE